MRKREKNRKKIGIKNIILCVIVSLIIAGLVIFTITKYQNHDKNTSERPMLTFL